MEVIGIGSVGPFIGLANDLGSIQKYQHLQWLYDFIGIGKVNQFVAFLGMLVIILFLCKSFLAWFTQAYIIRFSDQQQRLLINKLVQEYLSAPYIYHTTKNSSSIIDTVIEVANTFTNSIINPFLVTFANILVSLSLFFLLCQTNITIMAVLLIAILPILVFFNSSKHRLQYWGKQQRQSKKGIIKYANHAFGGIKETKILGCEHFFHQKIAEELAILESSHSNFATYKILPRFVLEAIIVAMVIAMISVALLATKSDMESYNSILGIYALASIRMIPAISNSVMGINQLRNSRYTVDQLYFEVLELGKLNKNRILKNSSIYEYKNSLGKTSESQLNHSNRGLANSIFNYSHEVTLENISYLYPASQKKAIDCISLKIKKGESIAFIGKSGAGKTTLVDIILGLIEPHEGELLVDGVSIYTDLRAWQNLIGYIPQSIFLSDDTLRRNIAFGVPDHLIDQNKLELAVQAAQLEDVVQDLPNKLNTYVGERGVLLSGGQRQRVGIARALYYERDILVLDEATAALDNETEKLVTEAIQAASADKTLIIIAHRLTTVKQCDRIYLMDNGSIDCSGSYEDVVLKKNIH